MSGFNPTQIGQLSRLALLALLLINRDLTAGETPHEIDRRLSDEVFAKANDATLAPKTDDETFLRRVYLDTVGENPTPGEITLFVLDPSPNKRERTIDRLLADSRYGTNWARYWRDVIVARRSAAEQQIVTIIAGPLEAFLAERLNANSGWDNIARAFVEAEGTVSDRGETALFMLHMAQTSNVAAETSRIFLGIQIQCAECHDHPFDRWKRPQFHEFAAFFPRIGIQREKSVDGRPNMRIASFDNGPIARPANGQQGGREHFMPDLKQPTAQGKLMTPVFFATGQTLETGATDATRRGSLGQWMTAKNNPWFAKAFVNRVWAELVGEGFSEPVDDLGLDRASTAPETWDYLASDFADHGYDVKRLFRAVLTSAAYQRECRPKRLPNAAPFTANVRQPLRADQLIDVVAGAIGVPLSDGRSANRAAAGGIVINNGPRNQLVQLFGYDPSLRREEITSTIPQALMMMNSPMIHRPLDAGSNSWFGSLVSQTKKDDSVVLELYLRCLAREPNDDELAVCREHLRHAGSRLAGFEDVFWSLLNSEEIRFRN